MRLMHPVRGEVEHICNNAQISVRCIYIPAIDRSLVFLPAVVSVVLMNRGECSIGR